MPRHYLMCPPTHFEVAYAINPWMDPDRPVDRTRALAQWRGLRDTHRRLGHRVDVLPAVAGLPDMVFAANGAIVVDGIALGARFATSERAAEADHHLAWLRANGFPAARGSSTVQEGEGDLVWTGDMVLAGTGYRTEPAAHAELAAVLGREVVTLRLVDPRYYHLDTALVVLDDRGAEARRRAAAAGQVLRPAIAWLPSAFDDAARAEITARWPDALVVGAQDAAVLACNATSDGEHVVVPAAATGFAQQLRDAGYTPVPVELDELLAAGGGPKCCTLELRHAPVAALAAATG